MPLFGSSHTHDNKLEKPHHAAGVDNTAYGTGMTGATGMTGTDYGAGATGPGVGRTHDPRLANDPLAPGTGTAGMGEPGMGHPATVGGRHHVPAGTHNDGMLANEHYGPGAGGAAIPPTGTVQHQPHSGGSAMTGKIEHAVGSMVGSKTLKAKGIAKEQEARGLKVQSQELAEAERLEQEAGMRRERAVAHGAHPDNRHVGGVVPGQGGPGAYH
ncbi:hypothetical protein DFH09DRAFT_1360264 [Mycena vulgaris]|nr:hypothetical protein DFH09DRAFT_1360264 [Mycena vulgaris]